MKFSLTFQQDDVADQIEKADFQSRVTFVCRKGCEMLFHLLLGGELGF